MFKTQVFDLCLKLFKRIYVASPNTAATPENQAEIAIEVRKVALFYAKHLTVIYKCCLQPFYFCWLLHLLSPPRPLQIKVTVRENDYYSPPFENVSVAKFLH